MRPRLAAFATAFLLGMTSGNAVAHQAPNSVVDLDFGPHSVHAELLLPVSELAYALPASKAGHGVPGTVTVESLASYLPRHIAAETPSGQPWTLTVVSTIERTFDGHAYLDATLEFTPPPGASARRLVLLDDVITHEVRNHYIMVLARSDYEAGLVGTEPELVGFLQYPGTRLAIERTPASSGRGFRSAFTLGVAHIASGTDHLLFLLTLLMPAALVARGGAWAGRRELRSTLVRLVGITSAFTIGHSATLIGAAVLGWSLPARPVEVLIALSILVSAVHAWRPVFAGREALVAGGFGLVHGLAFAAALGSHVDDPLERGLAILGFNLGIECVQIAIVAIATPLVVLLASGPVAAGMRRIGSALAGALAVGWMIERTLDLPELPTTPIGPFAVGSIAAALAGTVLISIGGVFGITRLARVVAGMRAAAEVRGATRTQ